MPATFCTLQLTLHSRMSEDSATKTVRTAPAIMRHHPCFRPDGCISLPLISAPLRPRAIIAASAAAARHATVPATWLLCMQRSMPQPMNDVFVIFTRKTTTPTSVADYTRIAVRESSKTQVQQPRHVVEIGDSVSACPAGRGGGAFLRSTVLLQPV